MAENKYAAEFGQGSATVVSAIEESLRDEGRREVLREIAKLRGSNAYGCPFCDSPQQQNVITHRPDCLWLRARASQVPR